MESRIFEEKKGERRKARAVMIVVMTLTVVVVVLTRVTIARSRGIEEQGKYGSKTFSILETN